MDASQNLNYLRRNSWADIRRDRLLRDRRRLFLRGRLALCSASRHVFELQVKLDPGILGFGPQG